MPESLEHLPEKDQGSDSSRTLPRSPVRAEAGGRLSFLSTLHGLEGQHSEERQSLLPREDHPEPSSWLRGPRASPWQSQSLGARSPLQIRPPRPAPHGMCSWAVSAAI